MKYDRRARAGGNTVPSNRRESKDPLLETLWACRTGAMTRSRFVLVALL